MAGLSQRRAGVTQKSVLLVGTGALATLFAVRLAKAGFQVNMLGNWPNGLDALINQGARLLLPNGEEQAFAVKASNQAADFAPIKLAFVLVKAWQTEQVAERLINHLDEDGLVVTLQNGLGNKESLGLRLGLPRVLQGVTTTGAALLSPGLVRAGGEGKVSLEAHPRAADVQSVLQAAGFAVEQVADVQAFLWGKLVINTAINPLTALLNIPNGALLEKQSIRTLMQALAQETAQVAQALGINLPFADPAAAAEDVAQKTAENISSMLQDVRRGAPTEIDAICGAVVRQGAASGVATPYNLTMLNLIQSYSH